jgi:tetratricopeptide (TPR) repeat protein
MRMGTHSIDEILRCFSRSDDFNEILDAFQSALSLKLKNAEHYRLLFWNRSLSAEEVCFFGEKLAGEFPETAYDVFLWIAEVFEVTYSSDDNYELALRYYMRAAAVRPGEPAPYVHACDCYDADLNVPPVEILMEFVRSGLSQVADPTPLYKRLIHLCELTGDSAQAETYRRKLDRKGSDGGE